MRSGAIGGSVYYDGALRSRRLPEQRERIAPARGDGLWFQHMLLHAGLPVTRGIKHVLRTDVLYRAG